MPSRLPARVAGRVHIASLSVVAIVVLGCAPAAPSPSTPALAGTSWTVISINGAGVVPDSPPTIQFSEDGRVSGSSGCNQYGGSFKADGGAIEFGALQSTEMFCEGARGPQEAAFTAALSGARSYSVDADGQLLIEGAAQIVARPGIAAGVPVPSAGAGLATTAWDLVELGTTADFAHLVPTIDFAADGTASGFAGCNTFSGSYTTNGNALMLGPLATTKIACLRPASAVESDYLAALSGVTSWEIGADGRLALGGTVPLRFAAR
jgi:heat shock protein HslJ